MQEPALIAPLGVSVIDNKVIVSQPPDMIVYTDVDRNLRFDPAVDKREVLLTGFQGINHDHSLHSVTVGPDGKWVWNSGNTGAMFTDRSGKTFRIFSAYRQGPVGPFKYPHDPAPYAGKPSDDGHVYIGGFTARMNADGTNVEIIGHNYRNSYEQSVTSLGDVFQNDNDDPPACRVSWVMEYANFGFSSNDGQRSWNADRRPGQTVPVAEWRQDDPGMAPVGDVYGGGSPTGNVFYENGALGPSWEGTFLAADAGRNEIFSYKPARKDAGFALDRKIFVTTNVKQQYAGSDFVMGSAGVTRAVETMFRPSDVAVGPDGAIYISDWIDARVGGHQDLDDTLSGAIYRIAPKGFASRPPKFDAATIEGLDHGAAVARRQRPRDRVRRAEGARRGRGERRRGAAQGSEPVHARACDLPALPAGTRGAEAGRGARVPHRSGDAHRGVPGDAAREPRHHAGRRAPRARRRRGRPARGRVVHARPAGRRRAEHPGRRRPRVRRPGSQLPRSAGNGRQRQGASALRPAAQGSRREGRSARLARLVRMDRVAPARARGGAGHNRPRAVVEALGRRAPPRDRYARIHKDPAASKAMLTLADPKSAVREQATLWLLNRLSNDWADHGLLPALKTAGIYDPESITLKESIVPKPTEGVADLSTDEIVKMTGNAARGKETAARCLMCHAIGGTGADLGPALDGWGRGKSADVIATAIVRPNAEIALGYEGSELRTKDGLTIQGVMLKEGDPLMMRSMGGVTQIIPANRVAARRRLKESLMMSGAQLGLTAQDVADLIAFLRSN